MFGLQDSVSAGLSQVRGPVTALKEEPLATNHALSARSWMQPGIVDTSGWVISSSSLSTSEQPESGWLLCGCEAFSGDFLTIESDEWSAMFVMFAMFAMFVLCERVRPVTRCQDMMRWWGGVGRPHSHHQHSQEKYCDNVVSSLTSLSFIICSKYANTEVGSHRQPLDIFPVQNSLANFIGINLILKSKLWQIFTFSQDPGSWQSPLWKTTSSQPAEIQLFPLCHRHVRPDRPAGGGGEDGLHCLHREGAGGWRVENQQWNSVQTAAPLLKR